MDLQCGIFPSRPQSVQQYSPTRPARWLLTRLSRFFQWVTSQCQLFHRGELLIEVFTFHTRNFEVVLDCVALRRGAFHGLGNHWLRVAPEPVVGRVCLPNVGQHRFVSSTFLQKFWWCRRRCWHGRRGGRTEVGALVRRFSRKHRPCR